MTLSILPWWTDATVLQINTFLLNSFTFFYLAEKLLIVEMQVLLW